MARIRRSTVQRATRDAFATQLPPDFPRAVDLLVLVPDPLNRRAQLVVAPRPRRPRRRILLLRLAQEIGGRSDRQDRADRLDSVGVPVLIDEA